MPLWSLTRIVRSVIKRDGISSVLVATVVRSDLSAHGKVIRNSCPVPEMAFTSVMEAFALRKLLTRAAN